MQRAARNRLKLAWRESGKSYEKTAHKFGLNRGTVYAILEGGEKVSQRVADKLGIQKPKRYYPNWRKKNLMLRRWIRKNAKT